MPETVSGVKNVQAPDGSTFGILRWAPEAAAELRGNALVKMKQIVQAWEPENLRYLTTRPGMTSEYAMSSAIMHSRKPRVKADLTRVSVEENLAEGDRWGAVHMLAFAHAAELPLPGYGEEFVSGQFDMAMSEGDAHIAWMIARTMLREGDKIVKTPETAENKVPSGWTERERRAFEQLAESVLARKDQPGDFRDDLQLRSLFDEMRFRQDGGFNSENPGDLARRIAEKQIRIDLQTKGSEWTAIIDATEARMPDDYIANLRSQVSPTAADKVRKWWTGVGDKVKKFLSK